jgi:hypothetical protein
MHPSIADGLAGRAFVAIWHDIVEEGKAAFYEWHNREHMPERMAVTGFRRGRRYIAEHGAPEYFNLYEVESPDVLTSDEYLTRLNNPTPTTRETLPYFRNTARLLCHLGASKGGSQGGMILTIRFDVARGREEGCRQYLSEKVVPTAYLGVGVVGVHFGVTDQSSSTVDTAERKIRGGTERVPGWVVLVEGVSGARLERAAFEVLNDEVLRGRGALDPIERGVYRLECSREG